MKADARVEARWYAPLLRPVMPAVAKALDQLAPAQDPWMLPRTGLGGAMVIHVAKGFGVRPWRRAGRVAVAAIEGYNQRVHVGEPTLEERSHWLARDLSWARQVWESVLEHDQVLVNRVIDRLLGPRAEVCDRAIPEAVLFLRGAVAAGAIVGDVPDGVHHALDRHATWLGLSWEAHRGTLDAEGWSGALAALGLRDPFPACPAAHAHTRAARSLEELPPKATVGLLLGALDRAPLEPLEVERSPRSWLPLPTPALAPKTLSGRLCGRSFAGFSAAWRGPIETALRALTDSGSDALHRATAYLLDAGGKRVRPLITLAAAAACGGDPARALPVAAAVEWLHQATLVLDDIIDDAPVRRGSRPLHLATSDAFATGIAVFVFTRVLRRTHAMHPAIRQHLARAAVALAEGERLELSRTGDPGLALTTYYTIIEAKTARLFSAAALTGALAVEAETTHAKALGRYGREIGLAFQIVDDLLDYIGDEGVLGKRPGTDLTAGKVTLPLILLSDRLDRHDRRRLASALGDRAALGWVRAMIDQHDVIDACEERAGLHRARAQAAIAKLPDAPGRQLLVTMARELGARRC